MTTDFENAVGTWEGVGEDVVSRVGEAITDWKGQEELDAQKYRDDIEDIRAALSVGDVSTLTPEQKDMLGLSDVYGGLDLYGMDYNELGSMFKSADPSQYTAQNLLTEDDIAHLEALHNLGGTTREWQPSGTDLTPYFDKGEFQQQRSNRLSARDQAKSNLQDLSSHPYGTDSFDPTDIEGFLFKYGDDINKDLQTQKDVGVGVIPHVDERLKFYNNMMDSWRAYLPFTESNYLKY